MKRILTNLTLALVLFSTASFANETTNVNDAVLRSFTSSFRSASQVEWTVTENFFKANFVINGQYAAAYYNQDGSFVALTRNVCSTQLPVALQSSLKNEMGNYWISELFEVASETETAYYVTLENADTRLVLKSTGSSWSSFQKQRKS